VGDRVSGRSGTRPLAVEASTGGGDDGSGLPQGCPLCGGASSPAFMTRDRNQGISDHPFSYARCARCKTLFLVDPPQDLGPYYPERYYELPSRSVLEHLARAERYKLAFLRSAVERGRVVEVGPGFGVFALLSKRAGYRYTGIEMDERSCRYLGAEIGVEAIGSDRPHEVLDSLPPSDAIALWHVLEHLRDPWACLEAAARNLAPGGALIVAMPNPDAWQFRVMGARWPHVDAPRHLYLIPAATLEAHARELGLERVTLTSDDPGGRGWDRFGWQRVLMSPRQSRIRSVIGRLAGAGMSVVVAPLERRELKGAAYTAVLRKAGPA
jgi:SAM-dependent methyltransferase